MRIITKDQLVMSETNDKIIMRSVCYSLLLGGLFPPYLLDDFNSIAILIYASTLGGISYVWSYIATWMQERSRNKSLAAEIPFVLYIIIILLHNMNRKSLKTKALSF